jgi:hypothetical protein
MASIGKRGNKWRVQVRRNGVSKTEYFPTQKEAKAWAAKFEGLVANDLLPARHSLTLKEALGSVDISSQQQASGGEVDESEVALGEFVEAGKDAPLVLEIAEHDLDLVAFLIKEPVGVALD